MTQVRATTGARVLVLGPVPDPHSVVPVCLSAHLADTRDCTPARPTALNANGIAAEAAAVRSAGGQYADVSSLFCTASVCPVVIGNDLVFRDDNHVTVPYASTLGPVLGMIADAACPPAAEPRVASLEFVSDLVLYEVRDRCRADYRQRSGPPQRGYRCDVPAVARRRRGRRGRGARRGGDGRRQGILRRCRPVGSGRRRPRRPRTHLCRLHGRRAMHPADYRRRERRGRGRGPQPGAGRRCPHRRAARPVRPPVPEARYPSRWRRYLDVATRGRSAGGARRAAVRDALRRRNRRPPWIGPRSADDPVAAALALAAGPASAPREVVLATKASMRATAIPGFLDTDHHAAAKDIELGPQATSIESPEFKARLAAAQQR